MRVHGPRKAVLEVVFEGEVGHGPAVTAEFYTLAAVELQRKAFRLWYDEAGEGDIVRCEGGLFPLAISASEDVSRESVLFRFLGTLVGKALLDGRRLSLPLSPQFFKALVGKPLDGDDALALFPQLRSTLQPLRAVCVEMAVARAQKADLEEIWCRSPLSGFCLNFSFGVALLKERGDEVEVDAHNVEEFSERLLDFLLASGVSRQLQAVREGLGVVLDVKQLLLLGSFADIRRNLCGEPSVEWTLEELHAAVVPSHGAIEHPQVVEMLCQTLVKMAPHERADFLQFATGFRSLPPGGIRALKPPISVILKNEANCLPSVSACHHILKLPLCESEEVLRERLLLSISSQCDFSFN